VPFRIGAGVGKHASTHADGGSDEITGDLDIDAIVEDVYEIYDDWDDNELTDRSLGTTTTNYNLLRAKFFRPSWATESGSPSASDGVLVLPSSTTVQSVSTFSDFTVGTWEFDFKWANTTATQYDRNYIMKLSGEDTGYRARANNDGSMCNLDEVSTGTPTTIIDNTWAEDTDWHTLKTTRDSDGNFELFLDGASKGTATDTTHTTSDQIWIRDDGNNVAERHVDNLKVHS